MSAAAAAAAAPASRPAALDVYRDDGPLALAVGRALRPAARLPAPALALAGAVALLVAIAATGDGAARGLVAALVAWLVVTGGASGGAAPSRRAQWAVPPLVRLSEYAALLWIAAVAGPRSEPAAFALLAALAFRHYDLMYRLRHRGDLPPRWLNRLAAGWDGRLVIASVLLLAGALPAGFYVWAGLLGAVSVAETVGGWRRFAREERPAAVYEDEEDEGQ
jgi:uncharacterized protein DUF5941